jgi:hypothetical protein
MILICIPSSALCQIFSTDQMSYFTVVIIICFEIQEICAFAVLPGGSFLRPPWGSPWISRRQGQFAHSLRLSRMRSRRPDSIQTRSPQGHDYHSDDDRFRRENNQIWTDLNDMSMKGFEIGDMPRSACNLSFRSFL